MANAPQWGPIFDGVIQWGSLGEINAGPGPGTGQRQRWVVYDTFGTIFTWPSFQGTQAAADTTPVTQPPRGNAGAIYASWERERSRYERSPEDVRLERERLGIIPRAEEIIAQIAARQLERDEQDAQKRFEELFREIEIQGLEWNARYLEALAAIREEMAVAERKRKDDEEIVLITLMLAAAI